MQKKETGSPIRAFNRFSHWVTKATGSPIAFLVAILIVIGWAICGPFFHYSEVWQLVINTSTTIVTFLMMFVIQQSQNRDTMALHLKLNELLSSNKDTSNRLVASEDLTEEELEVIKKYYKTISDKAVAKNSLFETHSLDEAKGNIKAKPFRMKKQ
ncbi:MAG: low affinity iron permease family protein [Ferruginibacter sp.]